MKGKNSGKKRDQQMGDSELHFGGLDDRII